MVQGRLQALALAPGGEARAAVRLGSEQSAAPAPGVRGPLVAEGTHTEVKSPLECPVKIEDRSQ